MRAAARPRSSLPRRQSSFPITVRAKADLAIAREIARDIGPTPEEIARALTWGADENILLVLAAPGWLASRGQGEPLRRAGNNGLLVAVAASMKRLFDQTCPDRMTVLGHFHGISFSGKREDAFPSVRAEHVCARVGRRHASRRPLPSDQSARGRAFADAHRGFGPLGERSRRRVRAQSHSRADPRLWTGHPLDFSQEGYHADS